MITTSIIFDHRGRALKGSEGPVEVRVIINRKPYYINTGVRVTRNRFKKGIILDSDVSHDAAELNKQVSIIYRKVNREINSCLDEGRDVIIAEIKRKIWEQSEYQEKQTICDWIRSQTPLLGVSSERMKHYYSLVSRLDEFGKIRYWDDVTVEMLYKWDAWLHGIRKPVTENQRRAGVLGTPITQATVFNYHKNLKAILNRAVLLGVIPTNPYIRLRGKIKRGEKDTVEYLTEDQMKDFENLEFKAGTQKAMAHDIFVFQMYTGLSYADAQAFSIKDYKNINGNWVNVGSRIKTGKPYVSMLLQPAVDVLERNAWHMPQMNNMRYNELLKKMGKDIGVERLHSHMARHTFATFMLAHGAKIENVSKMLGHTNVKQTQRYAQVLAESVYSDFNLISNIIKSNQNEKSISFNNDATDNSSM